MSSVTKQEDPRASRGLAVAAPIACARPLDRVQWLPVAAASEFTPATPPRAICVWAGCSHRPHIWGKRAPRGTHACSVQVGDRLTRRGGHLGRPRRDNRQGWGPSGNPGGALLGRHRALGPLPGWTTLSSAERLAIARPVPSRQGCVQRRPRRPRIRRPLCRDPGAQATAATLTAHSRFHERAELSSAPNRAEQSSPFGAKQSCRRRGPNRREGPSRLPASTTPPGRLLYAYISSQLVASPGGCFAGRAEERRPRRRPSAIRPRRYGNVHR